MTTMTMARRATACTPHEVATATQATDTTALRPRWRKRIAQTGAVALVASFQFVSAGPAAVATIPTAFLPQRAAIEPLPPIQPREASSVTTLLNEAFPFVRISLPPSAALKADDLDAAPGSAAADPNEMLQFGAKHAPRWLVETILRAAHVTGVDPVYMMTLADVESSLAHDAKAPTSSAAGLFQFIDQTWLEILYDHAADHGYTAAREAVRMVSDEVVLADESKRAWIVSLKKDPYLSALMAGELIKEVQRALQAEGERELAEAELYLAHFFGAKAAVRFLKVLDEQPNAVAAKLFPAAAKANLGLFSESKGRKRRSITVAELYDRIDSKIVRRLNRYDVVVAQPLLPSARNAVSASAAPF